MVKKLLYPQPDFERGNWLNLNGKWEFSFDEPVYDTKINVPYPWGSPLSGISESKNGTGFYRRTVKFAPKFERVFLIFGAVDYTCEVKVNGTVMGNHRGGYSRFEFEVTDIWNKEADNVIEVSATDMAERSQTYGKQGYGDARGIWQTVWLESRPAAYIDEFTVNTLIDGTVTYDITTANTEDGTPVCADFGKAKASATVENNKAFIKLKVDDPKLWTPETPELYYGTLSLGTDTVSTYFGIREIGTGVFGDNNRRYITLNGKPYYINGVLDQSFNPDGFFTLPSDGDCRDEILRLKRIGINMARIHIKAEEPLKLYYADKLGMLIMEDIPCFWAEPEKSIMDQFEIEMVDQIKRDRNHPSIFYWVIFNETWGLLTRTPTEDGGVKTEYKDETVEWVIKCWQTVKGLDLTRLVEDNSACRKDHVITDVNTWHFYSNGHTKVKKVIDDFCDNAYVGTHSNYFKDFTMDDVPCMNSECGNVWGIKGNAGESDISWQYKYMINEFRLHDKLCGFVFTEFHDVVNEFNGYYKIDNGDKDFGYSEYGMSLRDLHSQDYLGADYPPMATVNPGDTVTLPLFGSSFTDIRHGKKLTVAWALKIIDPIYGDYIAESDDYDIVWRGYGCFDAGKIEINIPEHDGVAVLSYVLLDGEEIIMSNCTLFDIDGNTDSIYCIEPRQLTANGFSIVIPSQQSNKLSGIGTGEFSVVLNTADIEGFSAADNVRIIFEASTREFMTHDSPTAEKLKDGNYMLGYRCDPGENPNSFRQTDNTPYPGMLELCIDGEAVSRIFLDDCPADSRGALSHHYQPVDDHLDETGSYGKLCDVTIPSRILLKLRDKQNFTLTFRACEDSGISLFGRKSGRYGIGIVITAE